MLSVITLGVIMRSVIMLSVIMLSVIMLSVIMLSVIMLSVIMLSVIIVSVILLNIIKTNVIMLCHFTELIIVSTSQGQNYFSIDKILVICHSEDWHFDQLSPHLSDLSKWSFVLEQTFDWKMIAD